MAWGLEHFRLYIYGKPIKLLTDQPALEPLIKRNRSNKTYCARLTRWVDGLAHISINVSHIAGQDIALTDYFNRNLSAPTQADDAYDDENVFYINYRTTNLWLNIVANHKAQHYITNRKIPKHVNKPPLLELFNWQKVAPIHYLQRQYKHGCMHHWQFGNRGPRKLITCWRDIVKSSVYTQSSGGGKRTKSPDSSVMKEE